MRMTRFLTVNRTRGSGIAVSVLLIPALFGAEQESPRLASETGKSPSSFTDLFPDEVVARGAGFEIRQSEVDEMYLAFKSHRAAIGVAVPDALRSKTEAEIIEKLIASRLCLRRATDADKARARDIADKFIREQIEYAPSEESFNRQLRAVGMTPEKFQAQVLEQAIVKTVIDREVPVADPVTDARTQEFYEKNPSLFLEPELVRASHVLISTQYTGQTREMPPAEKAEKRKLANRVLARAREGEDFASLVREFSDDEASKQNEGEYTIARAAEDPSRAVVPEFEAAAFSLAPNAISDIVTTQYGYHIIKCLEKIPPKRKELSSVADRIKELLRQKEVEKALPGYIARLKDEAGVVILSKDSTP